MINAFIIYQPENEKSVQAVKMLEYSINGYHCDIDCTRFEATTPKTLHTHVNDNFPTLKYTYPKQGETQLHEATGLKLTGYHAADIAKKFACTVSHARLWKKCVELNEDIMILEHDAFFTQKYIDFEWEGGILGLNDPRGATRNSHIFHYKASAKPGIVDCPYVDEKSVPQGLAGNSAYIIRPFAAKFLISKLEEYGAWPNDALMCNQICPWLKVVYPYFSTVQGNISTTTT